MDAANADAEIWRKNLAPLSGSSRDGLPLSENRAPASDLAPWVARLVSAKATNDPDTVIACGMCNDLIYTRVIFSGRWTAVTAEGHGIYQSEVLQFGQHSRFMPLTCTGDIMSAGFGLRAGAFRALTGRPADTIVDRIGREDIFGLTHPDFSGVFTSDHSPSDWNSAIEGALRRFIDRTKPEPPDPISIAFEFAAFEDPSQNLSEFAESRNISLRQLERIVRRDFGITPKKILRRARALDLAALLCKVADDAEADEMMLRYFDQSHMIRDFTAFFGVTPREFRAQPRPLLAITLEQRQARRLEELSRIKSGKGLPWRAFSASEQSR